MTLGKKAFEPALAYRLRKAASSIDKLAIASEAVSRSGDTVDVETAGLILDDLARSAPDAIASWAEALPNTPSGMYLRARIAVDTGDLELAAQSWHEFFSLHAQRDPALLAAYARVLADLGRFPEAAAQLRRALEQPLAYSFFPRAEKLISRVAAAVREGSLRSTRVALLGPSTTALLAPLLKAFFLRDRIDAEFYQGLYGSVQQEILGETSGLSQFQPQLVYLMSHWRELQLPAVSSDPAETVDRILRERRALWDRLGERFGCHVVQFAYDYPAQEPYGNLATSLPGGRERILETLNRAMIDTAPAHVSILDTPALQRETGAKWEDPMLWHSFAQHPSTEALPALAQELAAHTRAVLGLGRKVLVTDLDNTLWKDVIGEDGLNGIGVGPGSAAGEAHKRLQQYLLDLKSRGVLLVVASKNNHADAVLPFEKHPHMALRLGDFAAFEANWNDKVTSLRAIASKLSLGLDSFVFLDDNPLEREWVRSQLPEVAVVELGPSVFSYVTELHRGRHFFGLRISSEDLARSRQYAEEEQRKMLQTTAQSLDDFLAQLQLRAWSEPVSAANLERGTQLTNKTNQFNLTTRRYTEAQVRQLAGDPRAWTAAFHLADRMGDYGLIGIVFCRSGAAPDQWDIDTWLMSCRVLGRQMEKFMFDRLIEAARQRGIREITAAYRPTAKNGLVRDHYSRLGFERVSESERESCYRLAVPAEQRLTATLIHSGARPGGPLGASPQ